eukprot:c45959_g1_i1.p1 GENE.c45959_g1_i1~~c45959_g1_i1.p1  ORF type:complete len:292 (+),score=46.39 c45959_g1_i1:32-907(+)
MEGDDEEMTELEAIQGSRETKHGKQFWVKYKAYDADENEWQPLSQMSNVSELVESYEQSFHRCVRGWILEYALATKQCNLARAMFGVIDDDLLKKQASESALGFMMWNAAVLDVHNKVKDVRMWLNIFFTIVPENLDLEARGDFYELSRALIQQTLLQCAVKGDWISFSRQLNVLLPNHHMLLVRKLNSKLREQPKGEDTTHIKFLITHHRAFHRLREELRGLQRQATRHPTTTTPKCVTDVCDKYPLIPVFERCHRFLQARLPHGSDACYLNDVARKVSLDPSSTQAQQK